MFIPFHFSAVLRFTYKALWMLPWPKRFKITAESQWNGQNCPFSLGLPSVNLLWEFLEIIMESGKFGTIWSRFSSFLECCPHLQVSCWFLIDNCQKSIFSRIFCISGNLFEFSVLWFLISYCATSSYLLVICTVLQSVDSLYEDYRFRLLCGILFQMSWTLAQFYSKLVIYLCSDWTTVTLILNIVTALIYFTFKDFLWDSFHVSKIEKTSPHSYQKLKDEMSRTSVNFKLNFLILCLTWFTIGYSAYGIQNTWKEIALQGKIFEHKLITSTFEVISKILALLVCLFVKRKILPLSVLQLFFAIIYFTLMRFDKSKFQQFQELDSEDLYSNSVIKVLLVHFTDFLHKAIFSLIWIVTAESFPETYR